MDSPCCDRVDLHQSVLRQPPHLNGGSCWLDTRKEPLVNFIHSDEITKIDHVDCRFQDAVHPRSRAFEHGFHILKRLCRLCADVTSGYLASLGINRNLAADIDRSLAVMNDTGTIRPHGGRSIGWCNRMMSHRNLPSRHTGPRDPPQDGDGCGKVNTEEREAGNLPNCHAGMEFDGGILSLQQTDERVEEDGIELPGLASHGDQRRVPVNCFAVNMM